MITTNELLSGFTVEVEIAGARYECGRYETREEAAAVDALVLAWLERMGDDMRHATADALREMFASAARRRQLHQAATARYAAAHAAYWDVVEPDACSELVVGEERVCDELVAGGVDQRELERRRAFLSVDLIDREAERQLPPNLRSHRLPEGQATTDVRPWAGGAA